LSTIALNQEQR